MAGNISEGAQDMDWLMSRWGQHWFRNKRVVVLGGRGTAWAEQAAELGAHVTQVCHHTELQLAHGSDAQRWTRLQADLNTAWPLEGDFDLVVHCQLDHCLPSLTRSLERSCRHGRLVVVQLAAAAHRPETGWETAADDDDDGATAAARRKQIELESVVASWDRVAFRIFPTDASASTRRLSPATWLLQRQSDLPPPTSENISVVIQGPVVGTPEVKYRRRLTQRCLDSVRRILPHASVVLSTWDGSDIAGLEPDQVVFSSDPGGTLCDDYHQVGNNVNRQIVSSLAGIRRAGRPYCLRVRSDLILGSDQFLQFWKKFPVRQSEYRFAAERILSCSIYSRLFAGVGDLRTRIVFHPSDFVFFGFRQDLENLFDVPLAEQPISSRWFDQYPRPAGVTDCYQTNHCRFFPEQHLWMNFVRKFVPLRLAHRLDLSHPDVRHDIPSQLNNLVVLDQDHWRFTMPKYSLRQYVLEPYDWDGLFRHQVWREMYGDLVGEMAAEECPDTYDTRMRYLWHDGQVAQGDFSCLAAFFSVSQAARPPPDAVSVTRLRVSHRGGVRSPANWAIFRLTAPRRRSRREGAGVTRPWSGGLGPRGHVRSSAAAGCSVRDCLAWPP